MSECPFSIVGMSEARDLTQRCIAALWDAARSLGTDEKAHAELAGLVDTVAEAEAQLAGLKLHLLQEARLAGAEAALSEVRESVRTTSAQAVSALKLSQELGERFELIGAALSEGKVSLPQAEAIVSGLRKLPKTLSRSELARCQESTLEHVDLLGPSELRTLAARLFEVIDPDQAPAHGGDRPTVHITMDFDTLASGLGRVLDGKSRPLDVGREKRLFTPAMIAALTARDKGCAFPNCHVPPASCHAHHIVPWWAWGPTCVSNGVLLCPHHHRLVEPDPNQPEESRWQVHLDEVTGLPWFTPPRQVDPRRRPRHNARFILHHIKLRPPDEAPPCPPESRELALEDLLKHATPAWAGSG